MAKQYGVEYPERPLMAVLSDLLAIPHFTTSRGSTVRSDFLVTVLEALGGDPTGRDKDGLIRACVETATGDFDERFWSPGGTVTNEALQAIIDGVSATMKPAQEANPVLDVVWDRALQYDPARDRRYAGVERSPNAPSGRARTSSVPRFWRPTVNAAHSLVQTLSGALEAAHITPYRGAGSNVVENGICPARRHPPAVGQRSGRDPRGDGVVLLGAALRATTYADLHWRRPAGLPRSVGDRPTDCPRSPPRLVRPG